jgi:hypothetical protein
VGPPARPGLRGESESWRRTPCSRYRTAVYVTRMYGGVGGEEP